MYLAAAGLLGLLTALSIHWITWILRLRYPSLVAAAGILSALGLSGFFLLFLTSDIWHIVRVVMIAAWAVALGIGWLQAHSLGVAWWRGAPGVFFEMAVGFLAGAAVNLTLQRYLDWLGQHFPGLDVYAAIDAFLRILLIALLALAVLRPLLWRSARPA